jgi:hypothetical protein
MNAKEEFLSHVGSKKLLCAKIQKGDDYGANAFGSSDSSVFNLTTGWGVEDWSKFLTDLDFEYDCGFGGQNLFGTIWYADGTWSDRGEYDGSEWWDYHYCPQIPVELDRKDKVREQKLNQIL